MPKYWPLSMANLRRYVQPDNMADLMAQMRYADPPSIPIMLDGKMVGVAVVHPDAVKGIVVIRWIYPCLTTHGSVTRFIRDHQLHGGTYTSAVEIWLASAEIADSFANDGIRTADDLSDGDIRDAVADWRLLRELGL